MKSKINLLLRIRTLLLVILSCSSTNTFSQQTPTPLPTVNGAIAGSIEGVFDVNDMGAATYSLSLAVPPGTAGMEPKLSLNYSSQAGSSFLGYGWSLGGLSAISRCLPSFADEVQFNLLNYDIYDRYCLDGQKLAVVSGSYSVAGSEYRTASETFSKITANGHIGPFWDSGPASFTVRNKNGLIYEYGTSPDSRLEATNAEGVLSWLLKKVTDRNGNFYELSYDKDLQNGELYPSRIDYTGNASSGLVPYNSVRFVYDPSAIRSKYLGGQAYLTRRILKRVEMYTGATKAWEYRISYSTNTINPQNYIVSIQECDAQDMCLPETTFTWGEEGEDVFDFVETSSLADLGISSGFSNRKRYPIVTGDWNGDGRTDIGRVYGNIAKFYISTTTGSFQYYDQITSSLPLLNNDSDGEAFPLVVGDWNGDGRTDVLRANLVATGASTAYRFFTSTGTGFTPYHDVPRNGISESGDCSFISGNFFQILTGDWNADGRTDIGKVSSGDCRAFMVWIWGSTDIRSSAPFLSNASSCSLNECPYFTGDWNGDGITDIARVINDRIKFYVAYQSIHNPFFGFLEYANILQYSPAHGYVDLETHPIVVGDWNHDGLTDFGRVNNTGISLCIGIGQPYYIPSVGFAACQHYNYLSPAQGFLNNTSSPLITGDWNSDGTTDIGRVSSNGISIFHVKEFVPQPTISAPFFSTPQGYISNHTHPIFVGDWNGDGFSDVARVSNNGINTIRHIYSETNSIKEIRNGFGGVIRIEYGQMTDPSLYTKGTTGSFANGIDVQTPMKLARQVDITDDATTSSVLSYKYKGFRHDIYGRLASGFTEIATRNELYGNTKTVFYRQDDQGFDGLPFKTETRLDNGTLLHKTQDTWCLQTIAPAQSNPYICQNDEFQYELDGTLVRSSHTNYFVDTWGNTTVIQTTRSDGSSESSNTTFINDSTNWLIGLPSTSSVTKVGPAAQGNPSTTRTSSFSYDSSNGRLLTEKTEPGNQLEVVKSYSHDSFGNIVQTTLSGENISPRSATTIYDSKGRFPVSTTNPLGQTETRTYSDKFGKPLTITDANGVTVSYAYDSFGREILVTNPDGTQKRTLYLQASVPVLMNAAYYIRTDVSGSAPSIVYFDPLSREIRKESVGFNGQKIYVDRVYDDDGRITHESEPYFDGDPVLWTVSEYDEMDRTTGIFEPGNVTTAIDYDANAWTSKYNPLGQATKTRVDDQGRLIESVDANDKHTWYKYDGYGNLTEVKDSNLNTTTAQFNIRGYKTLLNDPDSGVTTYEYDVLGNLLRQTNAKGEIIDFIYDNLGRLIQRNSPEGQESWIYDSAPNGIGKLHRVLGLHGYEEEYQYDSLGRNTIVIKKIKGKKYISEQRYNGNGLVSMLTYPSGFSITNLFNQYGYLSEIRRADSNATIWTPLQRNARGQLTAQRAGNSLITTKTFNPTNGLVQSIQTGLSNTVQNLSYQFDVIGNLTQRSDLQINAVENFGYDDLNRLISAQVVGQSQMIINYDDVGNIIYRSDVGDYLYGANGAGAHAVTSIINGPRANTYTYDAAGNRITSNNGSISYNSSGKPVSIVDGPSILQFTLDANQDRVSQTIIKNGAVLEEKIYFGKIFEEVVIRNIVKQIHYVDSEEGPVAIVTAAMKGTATPTPKFGDRRWNVSTRYLHKDHLGSIQTISNELGAVVEVLSFNAWGERRDPTNWTPISNVNSSIDRGFTGHEQLDEVNLIHMNGRVYDPTIGRFVSADPYVQSLSNMQSLNRYSYVNNNPLSFVDPSGYFLRGFFKKVGSFLKKALPIIVSVAAFYFATPFFTTLFTQAFTTLTCSEVGISIISGLSGLASGIVSSVAGTLASGGSFSTGLRSGLKGAHFSFLSAFSANYVGTRFQYSGMTKKALAHAVTNGAIGAAQGEKFVSSFAASFMGDVSGGFGSVASIIAGGTAASLTGGKFEQGVMKATIIHLYNQLAHMNTSGLTAEYYKAIQEHRWQQFLATPEGQDYLRNQALLRQKELELLGMNVSATGHFISLGALYAPPQIKAPAFLLGEGISWVGTAITLRSQMTSTDIWGANWTNMGMAAEHNMTEIFGKRAGPGTGLVFDGIGYLRYYDQNH